MSALPRESYRASVREEIRYRNPPEAITPLLPIPLSHTEYRALELQEAAAKRSQPRTEVPLETGPTLGLSRFGEPAPKPGWASRALSTHGALAAARRGMAEFNRTATDLGAEIYARWKMATPFPLLMGLGLFLFPAKRDSALADLTPNNMRVLANYLERAAQTGVVRQRLTEIIGRALPSPNGWWDEMRVVNNKLASSPDEIQILGIRQLYLLLLQNLDRPEVFAEFGKLNPYDLAKFRKESARLDGILATMTRKESDSWWERRKEKQKLSTLVAAKDVRTLRDLAKRWDLQAALALVRIPAEPGSPGIDWRAFHPDFQQQASSADREAAQAAEQAVLELVRSGNSAVSWTLFSQLFSSLVRLAPSTRPADEARFFFHANILFQLAQDGPGLDSFLASSPWVRLTIYQQLEAWLKRRSYLPESATAVLAVLPRLKIDLAIHSAPGWELPLMFLVDMAKSSPDSFTETHVPHFIRYGPYARYVPGSINVFPLDIERARVFGLALVELARRRPDVDELWSQHDPNRQRPLVDVRQALNQIDESSPPNSSSEPVQAPPAESSPPIELNEVPLPARTSPLEPPREGHDSTAASGTPPAPHTATYSLVDTWPKGTTVMDSTRLTISSVGTDGTKKSVLPAREGQEISLALDTKDPSSPRVRLRYQYGLLRTVEASAGIRIQTKADSSTPLLPGMLLDNTNLLLIGDYAVRVVFSEHFLEILEI